MFLDPFWCVFNIINSSNTRVMIPLNFFQTWETKEISPRLEYLTNLWKAHNPEFTYQLFDKDERAAFIKEHFDHAVYTAYMRIIPGALKADMWRYCVLYVNGGVYADIDTMCMNSLKTFIKNYEFVATVDLNATKSEGEHNVANAFIASVPRHPILRGCINRITIQVLANMRPSSLLDLTGPGVLGRELNIYLQRDETASVIGREGEISDKIYLLHFQNGIEYVRIKDGPILFQNKNGNPELSEIYNVDCNKVGVKHWMCTPPWENI